jgi:N6-adenosine-specific RNA methylase IME4
LEPSDTTKPSSEAYGKLREDIHLAGYTFERACQGLEWLLEHDRWQACGSFGDVNEFLAGVGLDKFRPVAEARKRIAVRIKELQPTASNRAIATSLGVNEATVRRDTASFAAPQSEKTNENNNLKIGAAANDAPTISGTAAAKLVKRREIGGALRKQKKVDDETRIINLRPVIGKFRTIVLDPAWEYDQLSLAGRAKPNYAMQTHEELLALDVRAWADQIGCHLYCWVTNNFMARACELVAHWGFQHRVLITWVKPAPFGLGSFFRNSTEHVLFATLGEISTRPDAASIPTHFEAPRGEHSEKPERFYEIVRAASYPPYGEGNQRRARTDFTNLFCEEAQSE